MIPSFPRGQKWLRYRVFLIELFSSIIHRHPSASFRIEKGNETRLHWYGLDGPSGRPALKFFHFPETETNRANDLSAVKKNEWKTRYEKPGKMRERERDKPIKNGVGKKKRRREGGGSSINKRRCRRINKSMNRIAPAGWPNWTRFIGRGELERERETEREICKSARGISFAFSMARPFGRFAPQGCQQVADPK